MYEAMFSAFRVRRTATENGDPGPEGVHQDSADLTIVIMMHRHNVAHSSGGNRVWSLQQPCGKPSETSLAGAVEEGRLLLSHTLYKRYDAIMMLDRKVKHEARQIEQADATLGAAIRDVLTIEVRRPRGVAQEGGNRAEAELEGETGTHHHPKRMIPKDET